MEMVVVKMSSAGIVISFLVSHQLLAASTKLTTQELTEGNDFFSSAEESASDLVERKVDVCRQRVIPGGGKSHLVTKDHLK
ncbi:hypothetical protein RUM44_009551 [Polyplax serrata]|uniref:Uncharacterized protein n=1 Tax=Polyplax serrata TaxID=468196 RepID=A0ABR1AT00_POLSC